MSEKRIEEKEPPIKKFHVFMALVFFVVVILLIVFTYEAPNLSKLKFQNLSYYTAIPKYDLNPYSTKDCSLLTELEKDDVLVYLNDLCSVYSKSKIEYLLACVEITERGWIDHCGVLSSESWKKLSVANTASG